MNLEEIARRIGFDHKQDYIAAKHLIELLKLTTVPVSEASIRSVIKNSLKEKLTFVTGGALCLKDDFRVISDIANKYRNKIEFVAADGTCRFLMDENIVPTAVISDLDGGIDNVLEAGRKGSLIVFLAHGDNIPMVRNFFKEIEHPDNKGIMYIPSVQIPNPDPPTIVLDGFTDGDRAVILAARNSLRVVLLGFDYRGPMGPYSKPNIEGTGMELNEIKSRKLIIAREIIDEWAEKHSGRILTANQSSVTNYVDLANSLQIVKILEMLFD